MYTWEKMNVSMDFPRSGDLIRREGLKVQGSHIYTDAHHM